MDMRFDRFTERGARDVGVFGVIRLEAYNYGYAL